MGEVGKDIRVKPITRRCAWCGLIFLDDRWQVERRKPPVEYTHGICPACRKDFFPKMERPKLNQRQPGVATQRTWHGAGRLRAMIRVAASFVALHVARWFKLRG